MPASSMGKMLFELLTTDWYRSWLRFACLYQYSIAVTMPTILHWFISLLQLVIAYFRLITYKTCRKSDVERHKRQMSPAAENRK